MNPYSDTSEYRENPVFMELVSLLGNGFVLSLFNIDFLFFEYLFPIVGSSIMLYGCHLIRNYNHDFLIAYYLAFARFVLMMFNFLMDWTSINSNLYVAYLQITISAVIIIFLFIQLDKGFGSMYIDANLTSYEHHFSKYILLYLCNVVSTYLTIQLGILGALIAIIILLLNVLYVALVFHRVGKDLTSSNLDIEFATYSSKHIHHHILFITGYILILALTIYFNNKSTLLASQSPDNNIGINHEFIDTKSKLISLGMQKNIVEDLSPRECQYLSTAISLSSQTDTKNANGGTIKFTTYRIKLYNSERILIYYKWLKEPENRLYQILEYSSNYLQNICELNSCFLYNNPDSNTSFEISSIENSINESGHPYTNQKISNIGDTLRGYFAFSYSQVDNSKLSTDSIQLNLYYQVSIFNLPYLKIVDYMNHYEKYTSNMVYNKLSIPITDLFH